MSKHYDLTTGSDYLSRQMFLDPAGGVTIQRFESVAYPKIQNYSRVARGFFWIPEEISLTKDAADFKTASEAIKFVFTNQLLRLTSLDSLQGRAPAQIFTPVISVPELEALVTNWSFFETEIHSNSYSHIIRNVYNIPKEQFDAIHQNQHIIDMASSIGRYYDQLHLLNCKKECGIEVSEKEHIKAIWLALHTSYALEAIRFLTSFCVGFGLVESKIFVGNGNILSLIAQDELLHTEWTAYIINRIIKDDPRFAAIAEECAEEVEQIYADVIAEEKSWADYIFSKGVFVGLNAEVLKTFVDYMATVRLKEIKIKHSNPVKTNPLPWYNKHVNLSTKQIALQEQENTSYVIGALSTDIDYDSLPNL